ncbi:MAG TPA: histidine kinase [Solirubrobacteraceae bacterium]|jgi:signal transduction histidine kinase
MSENLRATAALAAQPVKRARRWMPSLAAGLSPGEYGSLLLRRIGSLAGVLLLAIWALTGQGYFWPAWMWLGLAVFATLDVAGRWAWRQERGAPRRVACVWALALFATGILVATWVLTAVLDGARAFWPAWALIGIATTCSGYSLIALHDRVLVARGKRALRARIELLTRTRRDAVDAAAAELGRIERDLHDGAQARLVALTLKLGRAELKLDDRPDVLELVSDAQREAHNAIAELRDLARGIVPPLLADRGLLAAVQALAGRYGSGTTIEAEIPRTLTPAVERAAYFVIAEALTNTMKHAGAKHSWIKLSGSHRLLTVLVGDDGRGGADSAGSGLAGLRARVAALDGTLLIDSPPGEGTIVMVSLPARGELLSRRERVAASLEAAAQELPGRRIEQLR